MMSPMAGRRTNLSLLVLLLGALLTGALAFAIGTRWATLPVVAHGIVGVGIVLLAPWKSVIARRGLRRSRGGRFASGALALLVVVSLLSGIAHSTGLLMELGGLTAMQLHVGSALLALPFGIWHVVARPVRPRRTDLSRRALLRAGALAAGSAATYGAVAGVTRLALPGRSRRFTGSYETGSFDPPRMPVTQWLDDEVQQLDPEAWRLVVRLRGTTIAEVTLEELDARREPVEATLDCTGGWFATQRWEGAPLASLIPEAAAGRSVRVTSSSGYWRRFPRRDTERLWLATRAGGEPLSAGHGAPARLVAPARRGFWWVKWVIAIDVDDTPWWWQPPFPVT